MEFNSSISCALILLLVLASTPNLSNGKVDEHDQGLIYDIDYRGPESHSSRLPNPYRSGFGFGSGGRPYLHGKSTIHGLTHHHHHHGKSRTGEAVKDKKANLG